MPLTATWLGPDSIDRITDVRVRCYGNSPAERDKFLRISGLDRTDDGDVLVLSDGTADVATATSHSMTINVRGTALPCQGVAWVGTVRSHRRRKVDGRGLASRVMDALAERARERGQAAGLLAPFRVSFYEAFGYGVVERQQTWTVPISILPDGDTTGFTEYRDADFAAALACRERQFRATHGDVATTADGLRHWINGLADTGFRLVDRQGDRIASQFTLGTEYVSSPHDGEQGTAVVHRPFWDSPDALRRMLAVLGTLRDQYSMARLTLPTDVPLNWWLRERQIPHRRVDHPAARCSVITRMQGRVIDTPAFVGALRPRTGVAGAFTIDVAGEAFRVEFADGRATAATTTTPADLACDAPTWAAMAFGDLSPEWALTLGRMTAARPAAVALLADVVAGPRPYCHEYF